MQKLSKDYIVGLVDGEGSFTMYVRNAEKSLETKRRVTIEPRFYVKLIEEDKEILERLQLYFGCGSVYFQKDTRPNHKNCYRYEVYNRNDLIKKIIPFFKRQKLQFSSKKRDFEIFCQMMEMIENKEHLNPKGLQKLFLLKQKMH